MTNEKVFEYARDDFNYPRFAENLLRKLLNGVIQSFKSRDMEAGTLKLVNYVFIGVGALLILLGSYLWAGLVIAIAIFLDQVILHLFVDRSQASSRFKHFVEHEVLLVIALAVHMWIQGHLWTGLAALIGLFGMYLLTNLQMKYDLMAIQIPRLYFLRWDRMGIVSLFALLGAWPGERAYLFVVLLAWFLAALTFYDYIWIVIQLAKKKSG